MMMIGPFFTSMDTKKWHSNILDFRLKIYSLKVQQSHLFSDYCY